MVFEEILDDQDGSVSDPPVSLRCIHRCLLGSCLRCRLRCGLRSGLGSGNWLRDFLAAVPLSHLVGDWLERDLLDQLRVFLHLLQVLASADTAAERERGD